MKKRIGLSAVLLAMAIGSTSCGSVEQEMKEIAGAVLSEIAGGQADQENETVSPSEAESETAETIAENTESSEAQQVEEPTEGQKRIMENAVSALINGSDTYEFQNGILYTKDLRDSDLVSLLSYHMRKMEDQESPDFEISVRDGKIFADRETALRYIRDLYGRQLDADTAKEYLGQWGSVTETEIGIAQAYGDGAASSQFTEWRADGTQLIVLFSYEVLFNVEDLNTSGMAKAVFAADADSSWGYHLVSLQMAEGNDADAWDKGAYEEIIRKYKEKMLAPRDESWYEEDLLNVLVLRYYEELSEVGYAYKDLNNDQIPELLIGLTAKEFADDGNFFDLYTMDQGKAVKITESWERSVNYLCESNLIHNSGSGGAMLSGASWYQVNAAGQLELVEAVLYDGYRDEENPWFYGIGGQDEDDFEPISEQQANEIKGMHKHQPIAYQPLSEWE